MKGYIRVKVQAIVDDSSHTYNKIMALYYNKFPYIYLSKDFSHYLSKVLVIVNLDSSQGGQLYRGFDTHYIANKENVYRKIKDNRLARKMLKEDDILKSEDGWLYLFNEELRLG